MYKNTDKQLFEGKVASTYTPDWKNIKDSDYGGINDKNGVVVKKDTIKVDFIIDEVKINDDNTVTLIGEDGKTETINLEDELNRINDEIKQNLTAGETASTKDKLTFTDNAGNTYEIAKNESGEYVAKEVGEESEVIKELYITNNENSNLSSEPVPLYKALGPINITLCQKETLEKFLGEIDLSLCDIEILKIEERKPWQWYSFGVSDRISDWDEKTFHEAAEYCTKNLKHDAYQTVYQRNMYYEWVQKQIDKKGYNSKWFGAAELVTRFNGVGGADLTDLGLLSEKYVDNFLREGNVFLFKHNIKNAKYLLDDGKISGSFIDANKKSKSFDGLSGLALDFRLVEFEQSKVQEYLNKYKGNDLDEIIKGINDLMNNNLKFKQNLFRNQNVKKIILEKFNNQFNFQKYSDRVILGKELIRIMN